MHMALGHTDCAVMPLPYLIKAVTKHTEAVIAQLCHQALQQLQLLVCTHTNDKQADGVQLVLQDTTAKRAT